MSPDFHTITGEDWRRNLIAARQRFSTTSTRIRSQIPTNRLMPRSTTQQINDLLCRQGATGVSADDIMKIVQPIEDLATSSSEALLQKRVHFQDSTDLLGIVLTDLLKPFDSAGNFGGEEWGHKREHVTAARAAIAKVKTGAFTNEDTALLDARKASALCEEHRKNSDALIAAGNELKYALLNHHLDWREIYLIDAWDAAVKGEGKVSA